MKAGLALPRAAGPLLLLGAFAAGCALDALPGSARINLFAPPLLAMLSWNLGVYAVLLVLVLRRRQPPEPAHQRLAAWLHGAAALLASGAVLSMYARGSFFEFRAGWDSTFFDAPTLYRFMELLFGPAATLGGITLPSADEFAALRFSAGSGERAARWIHLYAITLGAVVIAPRLLLALGAARGAAAPAPPVERRRVRVLPYSYHLDARLRPGLQAVLARELGAAVELQLDPPLAQGDEDQARAWRPAPGGAAVLLCPLSATPETETHGALLAALPAPPSLVLLDESTFRRRFGGPDGARRLDERRTLWRRWLAARGLQPRFVDLETP